MKSSNWIVGWFAIVLIGLLMLGAWVYKIDPYMHFRSPDTSRYFYTLSNQRSQNDGITKHFDYDAIITGTSMTENFKTSEMDKIFGCNSIKVPYSGGSYKEINDNLKNAVRSNSNLKIVVRGLDMLKFYDDKNDMRNDLGKYPTYLYDNNPLNDVQYIWNRDVIWNKAYQMTIDNDKEDFEPGITSFDDYSNWQHEYVFGINTVCPEGIEEVSAGEAIHLTDVEKKTIEGNISENVTSFAKANPQITFYYFITPYSAVWWRDQVKLGSIYRQIEAEEYIIEKILECDNIKLFSFNNMTDITCDLNNYKDARHYGEWINSLILRWMHDGKCQLTRDNYKEYIKDELDLYLNMDYCALSEQEDYENDFYATILFDKELSGVEPVDLLYAEDRISLCNASIVDNQHNGTRGIDCIGRMKRKRGSEESVFDSVANNDYVGAVIDVSAVDDYSYLVFYGKKVVDQGQPSVYVLDENYEKVGEVSEQYRKIDGEWHRYVIDISKVKGDIKIIFNGGYINNTGNSKSEYIFSDICIY